MSIPRGWYHAWQRSIPVQHRVSGLGIDGSAALRDLKEYDPAVKVMWDQARQVVVIWRQPRAGEFPVLVADSPFGTVVDQRLTRWLIASDTRKYKSFNQYAAQVDEENDRKNRDRQHEQFNSLDHGKVYHAMRKANGLGQMVNVPEQIG